MNKIAMLIYTIFPFFAAAQATDTVLIAQLFKANPSYFSAFTHALEKNQIQVLYTQIDRDPHNQPRFTSYSYQLNDHFYFYPASTVKLAAAIFALEKINTLKIPGLSSQTTMLTDSAWPAQSRVSQDSSAENGTPSIAQYTKKILLVSDNDAFNRLYEFVGRAEINKKLAYYGLKNSRILNRLSIGDGGENARHTNPVRFVAGNQLIYTQPPLYDTADYPLTLTNTHFGRAYYDNRDSLIASPFDLSNRNAFPLTDQQLLLKKLIFPEAFPAAQRFKLTAADYRLLYQYMSMYPTESKWPRYDTANYWPTYCKFLFYGSQKNTAPLPNIRIFNKVGDAYGFNIDNMYFVDYKNKVEFLLSAVILSNDDGIVNDDKYGYETVCLPFLKNLGQVIYRHELQRKKKYLPNLNKIKYLAKH